MRFLESGTELFVLLFVAVFYFEKRIVRTERVNSVIFEIARQSGDWKKKETGKTEFDIDFSRLVGPAGLEPATL